MHHPRKRFGQHFLRDRSILRQIVTAVAPRPGDNMIEIGAGLGALTQQILPLVEAMHVVELDRDLIPQLERSCAALGMLHIHQADALTFDYTQLSSGPHSIRLIGNLPYNISTPLIFHLLSQLEAIQDMHFMLQKEVVERMAAEPGSHTYGRLSVMVQYDCQVQELFEVKPQAFKPPPKVDSAVVRMLPYAQPPFVAKDKAVFQQVVRQAFSQRRKMLHNSLQGIITEDRLQQLHIDPNTRPEQLSLEAFVKISNCVTDCTKYTFQRG